MNQHTTGVHTAHRSRPVVWPAAAYDVTPVGDAWVATTATEFAIEDFHLVREQFPGRHVTLDGDVITVWPLTSSTR